MSQKKLVLICVILLSFLVSSYAQVDKDKVFIKVEFIPEYPGGIIALQESLAQKLVYPEIAVQNKIQGTVYVSFIVEKDGSMSNIKVIRGVSTSLDNEAIAVLNKLEVWSPGRNINHEAVRVAYTIPVRFKL